ncbi:MAG: hypothetical protein ACHQF0_05635 [Chitinophagales bacterium]
MTRLVFIGLFLLLIFSACQKNIDSNAVNGSWKLTEVVDKTTNTVTLAPIGSNMSIVITFLSTNKFAGHTLRNILTDGTYDQKGDEILFKNFSMTKIGEDQWGQSFLAVLNACSLQSVTPCFPSRISIQGNLLKITTPLRYDIILEKL